MDQTRGFQQMFSDIQKGDTSAFSLLMDRYEPAIRREVRFRLLDGRLKLKIEESDVLQSVMLRLWIGLRTGELNCTTPERLFGLLRKMTQNRLVDLIRHWTAECRDVRAQCAVDWNGFDAGGRSDSPSLTLTDALESLVDQLPERDRQILESRRTGCSWEQIAHDLGEDSAADSLRRQHQRVVNRLIRDLYS